MKKKVKNGLDAPRDEAQRKLHAAAEKYIGVLSGLTQLPRRRYAKRSGDGCVREF